MLDNIIGRMCEISGMCFSILAGFVANNNQVLSWGEVGNQVVFAFITGIVGGLAGLLVKLLWNKLHNKGKKDKNKGKGKKG